MFPGQGCGLCYGGDRFRSSSVWARCLLIHPPPTTSGKALGKAIGKDVGKGTGKEGMPSESAPELASESIAESEAESVIVQGATSELRSELWCEDPVRNFPGAVSLDRGS